jgi:formate dehydrogenase major subunit
MGLSRRGFIKLTGAGLAVSSLGALGFGPIGEALAASIRAFKLTATTETHNTCTYCSVACGILIYSLGDRAKNAKSAIVHIEGDPDHPVNRGALCPKGSALLDIVHCPTRLTLPKYRAPGGAEFKPVTWDFALDRKGRMHALRRPRLPEGLLLAGRDRPARQRHRRFHQGELHRLRLLRQRLPVQHPTHQSSRSQGV